MNKPSITTKKDRPTNPNKYIDFDAPIKTLPLLRPQYVLIETSILETLRLMKASKIGSILVVDEKVQLKGIATERDFLMKVWGNHQDSHIDLNLPIEKVMTNNPKTLTLEDPLWTIIKEMHLGNFRHIPIVNEGNSPVGIVSVKDILNFIHQSLWPH